MNIVGMISAPFTKLGIADEWEKVPDGFVIKHTDYDDEVEGYLPTSNVKILKSDIDEILANPNNAYTLWAACKVRNGTDVLMFENVYAQTVAEKITPPILFQRRQERAYAILLVPPSGMQPSLIAQVEKPEYIAGLGEIKTYTQANNEISKYIESQLPKITLVSEDHSDTVVKITATASENIDGSTLYWESTGGVLNRSRSTFNGTKAITYITKPFDSDPYRVKCGFKYYQGLAEISL